jgi:hypothetical protein
MKTTGTAALLAQRIRKRCAWHIEHVGVSSVPTSSGTRKLAQRPRTIR